MCKYYQIGRFSELGSEEFDETSAFFHLEQAAELSVKEALLALAKVYLDLSRDLLPNYQLQVGLLAREYLPHTIPCDVPFHAHLGTRRSISQRSTDDDSRQ